MERFVCICLALVLFSCADSKQSFVNRYSMKEISTELGDEYAEIVKDLKAFHAPENITRTSRGDSKDLRDNFWRNIDHYKLSTLSYNKFNNQKFYENPSEENLQNCMEPLKKLNIIAERDGIVEWRLVVEKKEGYWMVERMTYEYGDVISWLCDSLYAAGTTHCKIFLLGSSREFVTYEKNGEPLYFRITGEPISAGHLCEFFVDQYKAAQEQQKYIREHPELIIDHVQTDKTGK